jgi:hypothetical protein
MSNNSKVGGILSIVSGAIGLVSLIFTVFSLWLSESFYNSYYSGPMTYEEYRSFFHILIAFMLIFGIVFCSLAIAGGIVALKKKLWGLALAGSIASLFIFFPCGIPAVIFTAIGKSEFNHKLTEMAAPINNS